MVNHRKSWAGNVFVWLDLTLDPFFKVERGYCICSISLNINSVLSGFSLSLLVVIHSLTSFRHVFSFSKAADAFFWDKCI